MRKTDAFRRAAALLAALSITVSLAAPAFADIYYIDDGDIIITKDENGRQTVKRGESDTNEIVDSGEIIITTREQTITTQESDLEGPAAEDSGFGPVVEDNYQPAQPEDAEEPKDDDQPESTEEPEDADQPEGADRKESTEEPKAADQQENAEESENTDRQEDTDQQAAPADAVPAAPAPANGFCKNIITVINKCADKVLNLTLKDVKIDVSDTGIPGTTIKGKAALSVQGQGNVEIELDGDNELKSGANRAGLEKNTSEGTLTLKDDKNEAGSLKATGGENGAGISGGNRGSGKNITIKGGTVNATGGLDGAGIGGGLLGNGEDITITGGTVNAAGGRFGAGIGGGLLGSGKNITITDGTVNAAGGQFGAGIGGGDRGSGEDITIKGGTVNAAGGLQAAGIGGGNGGGGSGGSGNCGSGKNITINGGTVNVTGGYGGGAGIGGGAEGGGGNNITITGGTVNATGGYGGGGAGIGGGDYGSGKNITINGGTVTADGGDYSAGIGGGNEGSGEDITINGGTVTAAGSWGAAGIGGGERGNGEDITITDGTVNAAGGVSGAGIGGGWKGSGSNVTVSGAAQVTAIAGKPDWGGAGATIGSGGNETGGQPVDGDELQADIDGLTTGYIHHIIYEQDGTTIKKEWREPERPQPNPEDPNAPAEESNEVNLGTPGLHVETLEGDLLPFDAQQQGSTLRVTSNDLSARLHGTRQALEALREQGVEQIQFVTTLKTTTLPVAELLAEGGSWFALEHNGLVSRRLSAAQAESLKCWMH